METNNFNDFNTNSVFPNIDQLSETSRNIYLKDHEFQAEFNRIIEELDKMISEDSTNSGINSLKGKVSDLLNDQDNTIAILETTIAGKIGEIENQFQEIQAAYGRLYSKILGDINNININVENRTAVFDTLSSYENRLIYKMDDKFGKKSPYKDGRADENNFNYDISTGKTEVAFRDSDNGLSFKSFPVIINPNQFDENGENIAQSVPIKLFEFTPIKFSLDDNVIPSFLAEIYISGDLYSYKGIMYSGSKDFKKRGVNFEADYLINQELPFSFKILYDKETNKVAVAFKFDKTDDKFTSIVKFDLSVNLLVGKNLKFAEPNTTMTYNKEI